MTNLNKTKGTNKSNPLKDLNPYEHVFDLYSKDATAHKDFTALHQKFKDRTFYESYRNLSLIALGFGLLVGACCVFLAFTYIQELLGTGITNIWVSGIMAAILLLIWEYGLKATIIPLTTTSILSRKGSTAFLLPICLAIIAGSMFTTLQGSNRLFYMVGTQNSDIRGVKDVQIQELRERQNKILTDREAYQKRNPKKSSSWLGADEIKNLDSQIIALQSEKLVEVEELSSSKATNTKHLFLLSLICEFLILICYVFRAFYEWKSYRERLVLDPDFVERNTIEIGHLTSATTDPLYQIAAKAFPIPIKDSIGFKHPKKEQEDNGNIGCDDVGTGNTSDLVRLSSQYKTTGKTLDYHQVKDRRNKYLGFRSKGEREQGTVNARINYYNFLLDKMDQMNSNRVEEIKFVKSEWLKMEVLQDT